MTKFYVSLLLSCMITSVGYSDTFKFPFTFEIQNEMNSAELVNTLNNVLLSYEAIETNNDEFCKVNLYELKTWENHSGILGFSELECKAPIATSYQTMIDRIKNEMSVAAGITLVPTVYDNDV